MTRGELAATSFALSFGLIIGFGIPLSIGATIIIGHSILLACDIIGIWTPENKIGMITAGVIGAVYSIGIVLGLQFVVDLFGMFPVNFIDSLSLIGQPIIIAFTVFPAVAVGYQHGLKKPPSLQSSLWLRFSYSRSLEHFKLQDIKFRSVLKEWLY